MNIYLDILFSLLFISYTIRTVRNLHYYLAWWEIKEYRLDRMLIHIRETKQGKDMLFDPLSGVKIILITTYLFTPNIPSALHGLIVVITIAVYVLEAIKYLFIEKPKNWKVVPRRLRTVVIYILTAILLGLFIYFVKINITLRLLIADKLLPAAVYLLIELSNFIFNIHKKNTMNKAREKINLSPNLKVISVTGSYGKTTTKELVAQILSKKYQVIKTLASQNTDIGVAERILNSDMAKYDYFVCEMAAYKRGEIASTCSMFPGKITISIITGINEQHQSLFKSLDTTMHAKYEVIDALNDHGFAVLNGQNKHVKEMAKWNESKYKNRIFLTSPTSIRRLPNNLKAQYFKENLSLAIKVAQLCKMSDKEIETALETIKLPQKTMTEIKYKELILIDDTFNANPDGVYQALEYLRTLKGQKILVLQPLIELGNYAQAVHEKIGMLAGDICDYVILTNKNFNSVFLSGFAKSGGNQNKIKYYQFIPPVKKGVILFEGKEAANILNKKFSNNLASK